MIIIINKKVRGAKNGASTPPSSQNGRRHASSPAQEKHQGSRWTKQPSNAQTKIWNDKENEGNHNLPLCHYHFKWTRLYLMKLGSSEPIHPNPPCLDIWSNRGSLEKFEVWIRGLSLANFGSPPARITNSPDLIGGVSNIKLFSSK